MRSFTFTKYYSGDQIEKNEMGGAFSRCGGEERCIRDFGGETCAKEQLTQAYMGG